MGISNLEILKQEDLMPSSLVSNIKLASISKRVCPKKHWNGTTIQGHSFHEKFTTFFSHWRKIFPIIDTLSLAHLNSNFIKTLYLIKCKQKHIFKVFSSKKQPKWMDGKLKNQFDNTAVSSYLYHREVNQFPSKIEMSQV